MINLYLNLLAESSHQTVEELRNMIEENITRLTETEDPSLKEFWDSHPKGTRPTVEEFLMIVLKNDFPAIYNSLKDVESRLS